jgi:hypothetical protein
VYSFQSSGSQLITSSIASGFFGFSTIVGFDSSGSFFPSLSPLQSPLLAYPTTDGSAIFDFRQNVSGGVQNGYSTFDLVIETNATAFAPIGSISFTGGSGGDAAVSAFAPVPAPTPEPSSVLLYALGILFCGYFLKRENRSQHRFS